MTASAASLPMRLRPRFFRALACGGNDGPDRTGAAALWLADPFAAESGLTGSGLTGSGLTGSGLTGSGLTADCAGRLIPWPAGFAARPGLVAFGSGPVGASASSCAASARSARTAACMRCRTSSDSAGGADGGGPARATPRTRWGSSWLLS